MSENSPQTTLTIQRATLADVSRIAPLFDSYRQFYGKASDPQLAQDFIHARLSQQQSTIFLACTADAQAVGFTQLYPCFSSVAARPILILNDLFVAANARRLGTATQLIAAATAHAHDCNAARLALSTQITNTNAQRLYESLGWKRDDVFYHYSFLLNN